MSCVDEPDMPISLYEPDVSFFSDNEDLGIDPV
jgi:hypothetical protein